MDKSELLRTYNHLFWTEKIIEQLNNHHPELIAFQKKIPHFYDSIKERSEQSFLLFQENLSQGNQVSDCIDQSFQLAAKGLHISIYHLLQDVVYQHTKKEASAQSLLALSAYIRQYTGLFIEDGFPDTTLLKKLFVFAVEIALLPLAVIEQKLSEWESSEKAAHKILSYSQTD
jgi:uncharacterized protein DUF1896